MNLKRKAPCRAIKRSQIGSSDDYVEEGRTGHILATRAQDRTYLIKWKGRSWPGSHLKEDIEILR